MAPLFLSFAQQLLARQMFEAIFQTLEKYELWRWLVLCVLVFPRHPTISMEAARHWLLLGTEGVACVARHHKQREKRMRAGVEFKFRYFSFPLNLLFLFCLRQRRPLRLSPVTSRSFFRKREIIWTGQMLTTYWKIFILVNGGEFKRLWEKKEMKKELYLRTKTTTSTVQKQWPWFIVSAAVCNDAATATASVLWVIWIFRCSGPSFFFLFHHLFFFPLSMWCAVTWNYRIKIWRNKNNFFSFCLFSFSLGGSSRLQTQICRPAGRLAAADG